jgi:hypothetical protein
MISQVQKNVSNQEPKLIEIKQNNIETDAKRIETNDESKENTSDFEILKYNLIHNIDLINDFAIGKRIGFYNIGDKLGNGNFSQVKLGTNLLLKGRN